MNYVYHRSALGTLAVLGERSVDMIYIDPPFGTGLRQTMNRKSSGDVISSVSFNDPSEDFIPWLREHVEGCRHVLKDEGTMYLHLDHHWVHYAKVMMDEVFGKECFLNEVIWSYDFGGRGKRSWPKKHDNILVYVKTQDKHVFNWDDIDRVPYEAPEMQRVGRSKEEAEKRIAAGKVPTDVWTMSIVGTSSKERLGYPTQKPVKLVKRAILASSPHGGTVLDVFAGSGTTGAAALQCGRSFILSDVSESSIETMKKRFSNVEVEWKE